MAIADKLEQRAMKIPSTRWFRAVAPRVLPPLHRFMARVSGGRWHPGATIMLTTTGARSGVARTTPLEAIRRDDGSLVVVASNFAGEQHPAWSWNLLANPEAVVLQRGRERRVRATLLEGQARADAWDEAMAHLPIWRDYTEITDRQFRIFHLQPAI